MKSLKLALFLVFIPLTLTFVSAQSVENEPFTPFRYDYRPGKFNDEGELIEKGEISEIVDQALAEADAALEQILRIPNAERTFENTIEAIENVGAKIGLVFLQIVPLVVIGVQVEEAGLVTARLSSWHEAFFLRHEFVEAVEAYCKNVNYDFSRLNSAQREILERLQLHFVQMGSNLSGKIAQEVGALSEKIPLLESKYQLTLNQPMPITFTEQELAGVSGDFLKSLKRTDVGGASTYVVQKGSQKQYDMIVGFASSPQTREKMAAAYWARGGVENFERAKEIITLRNQMAKLTGYPSWAHLELPSHMLKTPEEVAAFLKSIKLFVIEKQENDLKLLLELKRKMDETATELTFADMLYFGNKLKEKLFGINEAEISMYFPSDRVIPGALNAWAKFHHWTIEKVENVNVKDPDITVYRVTKNATGEFLGHLVLDIYAREGKANKFCQTSPVPPGPTQEGGYRRPVVLVNAALERTGPNLPAFMTPREIKSLFHEFGHAAHDLSGKAPYQSLAGMWVAPDAGEIFSKFFEKFWLEPEVLDMLCDPQKKLPPALKKALIGSWNCQIGEHARLLFLAMLDFEVHINPHRDLKQVTAQLAREIFGVPLPPGAESHLSSFPHIFGLEYDSNTYSYLLSEQIAAGIRAQVRREGIWEAGPRYEETLMAPGGSEPMKELLNRYFRREASPEAFKTELESYKIPTAKKSVQSAVSQDGTLDTAETGKRPDVAGAGVRAMERAGLRRGEEVARAERIAEKDAKKGFWLRVPRIGKIFGRFLSLDPS